VPLRLPNSTRDQLGSALVYYNWIKIHKTLRVTTAKQARNKQSGLHVRGLGEAVPSEHGAAETAGTLQETPGMKDFIRLELELVLTFVNVARTEYSMGNVAGGDVSHNNAEKAYSSAIHYFEKLPDVTPGKLRKLMRLAKKAEDAIATLPKAATK